MYIYTKLLFKKREDYVEVCVYYSRNGIKLRESTHPYYEADMRKIARPG